MYENVVVIVWNWSPEIHGLARFPKVIGEAGKNRPAQVLLYASQHFVIALVSPIDDYAGTFGINSQTFEREQAALKGPQRRHIRLGNKQNHPRFAQERAPIR